MSLAFNLLFGGLLSEWPVPLRVLLSTLLLTPLMTYWFIPLSPHLLAPGSARASPKKTQASDRIRWPNLYKPIKTVQGVQFFRSR